MRERIGLINVAVLAATIVGIATTAEAQTPTAATTFDGTYAFVSSRKVNETYFDEANREHECPPYRRRSLTIMNGKARFAHFTGAVGPNGDLEMSYAPPWGNRYALIYNYRVDGRIDIITGTVHARRFGYGCNYDVVWQKANK